jgi:putative sigma-54 modulation protein
MPIEVTARHMDADREIQEYARRRAERILDEFPSVEHIHAILDVQKHLNIAEIVVQAKRHVRVEAKESSDSMKASIDVVSDKVIRRLRRLRDKLRDHKGSMKFRETQKLRGVSDQL